MTEVRAIAGDLAGVPGMEDLPYSYKAVRIEPPQLPAPEDQPVSEAEKAEVEAIAEAALASNHRTRFNKPEAFASKLKKYDWLYTACMDGYEPEADEIAFMKEYEGSQEYQESAKPRYDQMRAVFGPLPQFGGHDADAI
jgi:hypothetical protein